MSIRTQLIALFWSVLFPAIGIVIYGLTYWNWATLPSGVRFGDGVEARTFVGERAYNDLQTLTTLGPRVAGSEPNERFAVQYLLDAINLIKQSTGPDFNVELEVQSASGSYFVDHDDYPITSFYWGVQNVVVSVTRQNMFSTRYLLLNAHFDSAVTSPGAGDDGTMTVMMLEVMRQITQNNTPLKHGIIFLFNGCEENTMQGAHAFAAGHRLSPNVSAFINLDVAANSGREIMFQSGPNYPFLMQYYRDHVVRPYANTLGEEIFQMGLVPSFTDYETLEKVGGWPGLDFALSSYGYLYHTKYDALETISIDTLQHIGDNILALTVGLANAPELYYLDRHSDGVAVFFDFMHLFLVYYTETVGIVINILLALLGIALIVGTLYMMIRKEGASCINVLFEAGMSLIVQIASILAGVGLSVLVAVIVDATGRSLSWFTSTWLLGGLYFIPFVTGMTLGPMVYFKSRKITFLNDEGRVLLLLHAQCFFYSILLITLSIGGIRSAFILLFPIIFYTATTIVNMVIQFRLTIWIYVHLAGQVIPVFYFCSLTVTVFAVFISMTGRADNQSNPDLQMALFSSILAFLLTGFFTPLAALLRQKMHFYIVLAVLFVTTIIVMSTPVGFPFRESTSPQRYYIFHQQRNFFHSNGTIRKSNSIYYLHPQDRHTPDLLQNEVPEWENAQLLGGECDIELYCGIPFYINRYHRQASSSRWLPATQTPHFPEPVRFQVIGQQITTPGIRRFIFSIQGPSHMSLYVSPIAGCTLKSWTFSDTIPPSGKKWNGQNVYFVNLFSGSMDRTPIDFFIEIEMPHEGPSFRLTVVGQYMYHEQHHTEEYKQLLDKMPSYAHTVAYPGYLESWVF